MTWNNRIVEHGEVDPAQLLAHELNHRLHPDSQTKALRGVMEEVGWVRSVIVNKASGRILDGHARVQMAKDSGQTAIPVKYVDLDDEEEATVIALFDELRRLAMTDKDALRDLLGYVSFQRAEMKSLLTRLQDETRRYDVNLDDSHREDMRRLVNTEAKAVFQLGTIRISLSTEDYLTWRNKIAEEVGFSDDLIIMEIKSRLGLSHGTGSD